MKIIRRSIQLASLLFLVACSSSPPTVDGSNGQAQALPPASSGSDAVGSKPEDKLMADEKKADAPAEKKEADPFADLQQTTTEPSPTAAPPPEALTANTGNESGEMSSYTVKAGDTLMKIAFSIYGDLDRWKDLRDWNQERLKNANSLTPGMSLKYQPPTTAFTAGELSHSYLIKKGDTLATIADEVYGRKMKFKKLQKFNEHLIKNPNRIFAGFTLFYDISEKEMAEAEARRQQRLAENKKSEAPPTASAQQAPAPASNGQAEPVPSAVTGIGVAPAAPAAVADNTQAASTKAAAAETKATPAPAASAAPAAKTVAPK